MSDSNSKEGRRVDLNISGMKDNIKEVKQMLSLVRLLFWIFYT